MLGVIIGVIVGSVYEFDNYRAKDFDPFFYPKSFLTDDAVFTTAVAEALVRHLGTAVSPREYGRRCCKNSEWCIRFVQWRGSHYEGLSFGEPCIDYPCLLKSPIH